MLPFILIGMAVLVGGVVLTLVFWEWVVETITDWLHRHNLNKSVLMDAWVRIERFGTRARALVYTKKKGQRRVVKVEERELDMDEIDDEEVLVELRRRGKAKRNVMHLID